MAGAGYKGVGEDLERHLALELSRPAQRLQLCRHERGAGTIEPLSDQAPPEDPGNPTVNFHGERRRNDTHQSTTDPEAMLHRKGKGKEAKLAYLGHVLLDNRQGLVANVCATHATGTAERDAAVLLLEAPAP